jgi:hypothetical protein
MILPICLLLLATPSPTPAVPSPTLTGASGRNVKPPFSLTISVDQNVFKAGSEIRLHIAETNISDSHIRWGGHEDRL